MRALIATVLAAYPVLSWAQDPPEPAPPKQDEQEPRELTELSLEELMQIEITSVSKGGQTLRTAAAAITVIRAEDLRRTGVTSIPEALRMVPGMHVARLDANKWAVGARGFGGLFSNKLLVLIDGRTVYNPLFSGVFWSVQDLVLEDVERIEVIRGPGASVWGANAVNGVINIITKKAVDTQGAFAHAVVGSEERFIGEVRGGGKIDDDTYYRVYAKAQRRDEGKYGSDALWTGRAGFRLDHSPGEHDRLTLQGDYYESESGNSVVTAAAPPTFIQPSMFDSPLSGGNVLLRWDHEFDPGDVFTAQVYYDRTDIDYQNILRERRDTVDFDLQHRFDPGWGMVFTVGGGYRWIRDDLMSSFVVNFPDSQRTDELFSAFVQDEITLVEDHLTLTLGSKFEHNNYTGFEFQPGARLSWQIDGRNAVWASATRAVRSPSRIEHDFQFVQAVQPTGAPPFATFFTVFGDRNYESEDLHAFELGYRVLPADTFSVDVAAFYNMYDDLRTSEFGAFVPGGAPGGFDLQPLFFDNKMDGVSYGAEFAVNWDILPEWRLSGAYSFIRIKLDVDDDSTSLGSESDEDQTPRHQVYVRSSFDLSDSIELDVIGRYVDVVPGWGVDSYLETDVRLGWRPTERLELALVAQNLWHDDRFEAADNQFNFQATEVERGFYFSASVRF